MTSHYARSRGVAAKALHKQGKELDYTPNCTFDHVSMSEAEMIATKMTTPLRKFGPRPPKPVTLPKLKWME